MFSGGPGFVAVDVGGTTIKAAVVSTSGSISTKVVVATPCAQGPDRVIETVREVVSELVTRTGSDDVLAVGVVVPGTVDAQAGIARFSANIGWRDVPLRDLLIADTGRPTVVDHDVRAAGLAERTLGLTKDVDIALTTIIGTGIAGVVQCAGAPLLGSAGLAGELGHMPIWPDGEQCPCGQRGCLERYASAAAIRRRYHAMSGRDLSVEQVIARRSHDRTAARVWADATTALALAFAASTLLLDPSLIVLGGGLSLAGPSLIDDVRAALVDRLRWRDCPRVELSPLTDRAGLWGAAILAARVGDEVDLSHWSGNVH